MAGLSVAMRAALARFRRAAVSPRARSRAAALVPARGGDLGLGSLELAGEDDVLHLQSLDGETECVDAAHQSQEATAHVAAVTEEVVDRCRGDQFPQGDLYRKVESLLGVAAGGDVGDGVGDAYLTGGRDLDRGSVGRGDLLGGHEEDPRPHVEDAQDETCAPPAVGARAKDSVEAPAPEQQALLPLTGTQLPLTSSLRERG